MMEKRIEYFDDLTGGESVDVEEQGRLVRENWQRAAKEHGDSPDATIRDLYARKLNTEAIAKWLTPLDHVIDVGCGNGFQTAEYAKKAHWTLGVDYIPEFIRRCNHLHAETCNSNYLYFVEGDVRDMAWIRDQYGEFDKVVCERTIINLASWEQQKQALDQLASLVKVGGHLLLNEVTIQGHESVDVVRQRYGLEVLEKHWNNVYLDEKLLLEHLGNDFQLISKDALSLYTLLSKVINAVLSLPGEPSFDAPINKLAYELSHYFSLKEDIGHTVLYVFKKETW
jgi:ubiquinone/menaquinone biosynthesis C-methylase UbiE